MICLPIAYLSNLSTSLLIDYILSHKKMVGLFFIFCHIKGMSSSKNNPFYWKEAHSSEMYVHQLHSCIRLSGWLLRWTHFKHEKHSQHHFSTNTIQIFSFNYSFRTIWLQTICQQKLWKSEEVGEVTAVGGQLQFDTIHIHNSLYQDQCEPPW